jgi:hypothetical protein
MFPTGEQYSFSVAIMFARGRTGGARFYRIVRRSVRFLFAELREKRTRAGNGHSIAESIQK